MTRKELETKLLGIKDEIENRIKSAPVPAFFVGVIVGIAIANFWHALLWIVFLLVAGVAVIWLMSVPGNGSGRPDVMEMPPRDS